MALSLLSHRMSARAYTVILALCLLLLLLVHGSYNSLYEGRVDFWTGGPSGPSHTKAEKETADDVPVPGFHEHDDAHSVKEASTYNPPIDGPLPCLDLPGADDVVVVLKTGSTEFADKFPIHINTTLRCYKNYLVFSDHEELYDNIRIIDTFDSTPDSIRGQHPDFDLWRRLRDGGREALSAGELSGQFTAEEVSKSGKPRNPGWKLDKWKFLPMVNRTLHEFPNKKWYIFIEVDTYVMWQTFLNYLQALDPNTPYYIGNQIMMGDIRFAHGGTGFLLSLPALQNVVKKYQSEQSQWDKLTNDIPYGDVVLGKALQDSGATFVSNYPIFQGEQIGAVPYDEIVRGDKQLWCSPTVTYHHQSPPALEDLWRYEQQWIHENLNNTKVSLKHRDLFRNYILPRIPTASERYTKLGWTHHAKTDRGFVASLDACRNICARDGKCVQYLIDLESRCQTSSVPSLGEWARGIDSGWMKERVQRWNKERAECPSGDEWITS